MIIVTMHLILMENVNDIVFICVFSVAVGHLRKKTSKFVIYEVIQKTVII